MKDSLLLILVGIFIISFAVSDGAAIDPPSNAINGEIVDPQEEAVFDKIIDPPATTKVNISQFTVDVDKEIITVVYQTGEVIQTEFNIKEQKNTSFESVSYDAQGNPLPNNDYIDLYNAMTINIAALVTALQQKL